MGRVCLAAAVATSAAVIVLLAVYHLDLYPTTWFDEGSHLHVPKALVQYGVYADTSSEGFRYFGPTTGIGPTIMLPIAFIFKLVGIGLLQARLVIVVYLLVGLVLFWTVARRQFGASVALVATLLLVSSPGVNLLYFGRQVLGEVPAFAFLMLAVLLWCSSTVPGQRSWGRLVAASAAFGLVALTKNQFTLILGPTFVFAALLDAGYHRSLGLRAYVLPLLGLGAGVAIGLVFQFLPAMAAQDFGQTLALYRDASAGAIFVFSPARVASSLKFLTSADVFGYWGIPAVVYGLLLARERTARGAQQALLVVFVVLGLGWFALGSIGWTRYAFPALAVTAIFAAKLLVDAAQALRRSAAPALSAALVVVAALLIAAPLANTARSIVTARDRSPQQVAAYLDANVPASTVIETWEPELGFLSTRAVHYPPSGWLDRAVRAQWLGSTSTTTSDYDPIALVHPDYLVVGPFGKYTGIYAGLLSRDATAPIVSYGEYDIYRLK
jgi:4-amino-4-deoxy-L-arabinose transferase-like glycosyltransferase